MKLSAMLETILQAGYKIEFDNESQQYGVFTDNKELELVSVQSESLLVCIEEVYETILNGF